VSRLRPPRRPKLARSARQPQRKSRDREDLRTREKKNVLRRKVVSVSARVAKSSAHQQNILFTKPYQPTTIPAFGKECLHARRAPPEAPCHPCQTLFSERWWYGMVVWYFSQTLFGARTRRPARRTSIHGLTPLLLPRKSPILCQLVLADSTNPLRSRQGLTRHDATSSPSRL
jgi:hypothetical protein